MLEVDIAVNIYLDGTWKTHATWRGSSEPNANLCLRDVLSHEFGHFAGLEHVDYRPDRNDSSHNCSEWADYTMMTQNGGTPYKDCRRETLSCEDKWALHTLYHGEP